MRSINETEGFILNINLFSFDFFPEKTLCDLSVFENQKTYLMSFWDVVTVVVFVTFLFLRALR